MDISSREIFFILQDIGAVGDGSIKGNFGKIGKVSK